MKTRGRDSKEEVQHMTCRMVVSNVDYMRLIQAKLAKKFTYVRTMSLDDFTAWVLENYVLGPENLDKDKLRKEVEDNNKKLEKKNEKKTK